MHIFRTLSREKWSQVLYNVAHATFLAWAFAQAGEGELEKASWLQLPACSPLAGIGSILVSFISDLATTAALITRFMLGPVSCSGSYR